VCLREVQPIFGPGCCLVYGEKLGFELVGGFVSDRRVFAVGVVVTLDVFEDFDASVVGVLEAATLEHLVLEGADEGFGPSVVVGIGAGGHALAQAGLGQGLAKGSAPILAAAVAVEDSLLDGSGLQRLLQGADDEIGAQVVCETPTDDPARAQVDDDGQVEPSGAGGDEGDVSGPSAIGKLRKGLAGEEIGRGFIGSAIAGFRDEVLRLKARNPRWAMRRRTLAGAQVTPRSESSSARRR